MARVVSSQRRRREARRGGSGLEDGADLVEAHEGAGQVEEAGAEQVRLGLGGGRFEGLGQVEELGGQRALVGGMKEATFSPQTMGLVAIGGLKDDVKRPPAAIIGDLEELLAKTKTLGLRNAIRLILRDLYKQAGNNEKVLERLRALLKENDAASKPE